MRTIVAISQTYRGGKRVNLDGKPSVLVIDDDEVDCIRVERMIGSGYSVQHATDASSGLALLRSEQFDCVLLDYRLPDSDGLDLLAQIAEAFQGGIIMLTGEGNESVAASAIQRGAHDYVVKGLLTPELLPRVIEKARARAKDLKTLAARQEEYRHFAFTAAHDLRAPFRRIRSLCQMLGETDRPAGMNQAELVERINCSVAELESLIEGLLSYARMGQPEKASMVSLAAAFRQACSNLRGVIEEKHATVESEPLPEVWGDPVSMVILLQNLIGNALKFNALVPHVSLRAKSQEGAWVIVVQDNGIGIPPEHRQRLFKPFERLHGRGKYEGIGLGLATCRRIAEAHGGTISMESEPGRGSRFFVRLPFSPQTASGTR
jgi:hypothetical protein